MHLQEIWLSVLYHVSGMHVWPGGECLHEYMEAETVGSDKLGMLPILSRSSAAWEALREIVENNTLLGEIQYYVDFL